MFCFQLICDCGYNSEDACWGVSMGSRGQIVVVPVYDSSTGGLHCYEVPAAEGDDSDDDPSLWLQKYGPGIREQFGKDAAMLIPAEYDKPFMVCPTCGRESCRAISTGIV